MSTPRSQPQVRCRSTLSTNSTSSKSPDLIYECKAAYLLVVDDIDDALLSEKQLYEALQNAGRNPSKKMMKKYWTSNTDKVTFDEFVDICGKERPTTEDELMKAFKKIDVNGDGYITNAELHKTLTTRGDCMTKEEVQAIIDEVDENQDGKLDYKEFCKMVLGTQNDCRKLAIQQMEKKLKKKKSSRHESPQPAARKLSLGSLGSQGSLRSVAASSSLEWLADSGKSKNGKGASKSSLKKPSPSAKTVDNDSSSDSDDIVIGKSSKISASSSSIKDASPHDRVTSMPPKPKPRHRKDSAGSTSRGSSKDCHEWVKSAIAGKDLKLSKPRKLKDWNFCHSKGSFFLEDDGSIVSHQYTLKVTKDTSVYITMEPFSIKSGGDLNSSREVGNSPIDTILFVLREDNSLVTFTDQRDHRGKYALRCDLEKGVYKLIPFTSGCRLKPRKSEPNVETKLVKKANDKFVLTKAFKDALSEIFDLCDLDGNGYLSRAEFNCFNLRTSGEEVADSEWDVVEETVELKNGELTKKGFLDLNQMEAEDNQGDTEDLWVTLTCMGFNKDLVMDEACPFVMEVFTESCEGRLKVNGICTPSKDLNDALIEATVGKGESSKIKEMKDLFLHSYVTDFRGCFVIENKSHHKVSLDLDCSHSKNCISNCGSKLEAKVAVPAQQSVVAMHVMPAQETQEWVLRCHESVR